VCREEANIKSVTRLGNNEEAINREEGKQNKLKAEKDGKGREKGVSGGVLIPVHKK